jgi:hypothetical protein
MRIAWPIGFCPGKCRSANVLVDDRDPLGRFDVTFLYAAPAQQSNAERVEELRVDFVEVRLRLMPFCRSRFPDDGEWMRPHLHWQAADDAGSRHARQRPHAL